MKGQPVSDQPIPAPDRRVSDLAASTIRTLSPMVAGSVLAAAVAAGLLPDGVADAVRDALTAALAGVLSSAWYVSARWLERRQGPSWPALAARYAGRWMLGGVIRQPVYAAVGETIRVVADGRAWRVPASGGVQPIAPSSAGHVPVDVTPEPSVAADAFAARGRLYPVDDAGTIVDHGRPGAPWQECPGSGQAPAAGR